MESNIFWAFLAITFIVGLTLGVAIYGVPTTLTGKAMISPIFPGIICNDSDRGINLAVKGTCTDPYGSKTDVCASTVDLVEYWCMNGTNVSYCVSKVYNCPQYGYASCYDGACIGGQTIQETGAVSGEAQPSAVIPSGCTYQGVLNMLNKYTLTLVPLNFSSNSISCDDICSYQEKTCVQEYFLDTTTKITTPKECSMKIANLSGILYCGCAVPLTNETLMGGGGGDPCAKRQCDSLCYGPCGGRQNVIGSSYHWGSGNCMCCCYLVVG